MKKLTNLLLAAMLMFAFVACDSSQTTEETTEEVVEEVVETVEETADSLEVEVTAE
jgi:hypothetical protein